jgi:hypothetical protein
VTTRPDTVRTLSAIGAGVLLAATPHCGGQSEGSADDSNGGTENGGGGSGNAGSDQGGSSGYSGAPGTGGSSGYSGAPGTGGSAGYAGTIGTGGSYGGSFPVPCSFSLCLTPAQLATECSMPDGGIDAGADTGAGGTGGLGEGGFGGEASDPPSVICPYSPPYPCIGRPIRGVVATSGWNGTQCCYAYETDC